MTNNTEEGIPGQPSHFGAFHSTGGYINVRRMLEIANLRGPEMQPNAKLIEDLDWLTDKISTQVWTLTLGTLATTWSLLVANGSGERLIEKGNALWIMALCIIAMLCELGQYYAGYFNAKSILDHLGGQAEFEYDETEPLYIWRKRLFYIKAVPSFIAALWLVGALLAKLV